MKKNSSVKKSGVKDNPVSAGPLDAWLKGEGNYGNVKCEFCHENVQSVRMAIHKQRHCRSLLPSNRSIIIHEPITIDDDDDDPEADGRNIVAVETVVKSEHRKVHNMNDSLSRESSVMILPQEEKVYEFVDLADKTLSQKSVRDDNDDDKEGKFIPGQFIPGPDTPLFEVLNVRSIRSDENSFADVNQSHCLLNCTDEDPIDKQELDEPELAASKLFSDENILLDDSLSVDLHSAGNALATSTPLKNVKKPVRQDSFATGEISDVEEEVVEDVDSTKLGQAYFVKHFNLILNRVQTDNWHKHLFCDEDRETFRKFEKLDDQSKACFVRLFLRNVNWISPQSLQKSIKSVTLHEIDKSLKNLEINGFVDRINSCDKLDELLPLLSAIELRQFVRKYSPAHQCTGLGKKLLIDKLLSEFRKQVAVSGDRNAKILTILHKMLNGYCRINKQKRLLFLSLFHLFSPQHMTSSNLHSATNQKTSGLASQLLFTLLQKETGEIKLPRCMGTRETVIFQTRNCLMSYVDANELEAQLIQLADKKQNEKCIELGQREALIKLRRFVEERNQYFAKLAKSLRRFTPVWVYFRCCFMVVECMQKSKRYQEAVETLTYLLRDELARFTSKRALLYERLCINLKDHLHEHEKAFETIERAFKDPYVKEYGLQTLKEKAGKLVSILNRRRPKSTVLPPVADDDDDCDGKPVTRRSRKRKICQSTADVAVAQVGVISWVDRYKALETAPLCKIREKTIECPLYSKGLGGSRKTIFVQGDLFNVPVEQMAIDDYKKTENFTEALHDEGGSLNSLFGLLLWDVIYDTEVPDVWQCSQQMVPLDLNDSSMFSINRPQLQERLVQIAEATEQDLHNWIEKAWNENFEVKSVVQWNCFSNLDQAKRLASCVGGQKLGAIFQYLSLDYKDRRSGLPDLTLWNNESKSFKVVEVKGPGDVLSTKQRIWLSQFTAMGIPAELCKVQGVNARRLRV